MQIMLTRTMVKHPPIPHGNNVVVSTKGNAHDDAVYVGLRYENKIEVWLLGQTDEAINSNWKHKYLPLKEDAKKILSLTSKDNAQIINFDMAINSTLLAYITSDSTIRIFHLDLNTSSLHQVSQKCDWTRAQLKKASWIV